jgi:hypothetical protein
VKTTSMSMRLTNNRDEPRTPHTSQLVKLKYKKQSKELDTYVIIDDRLYRLNMDEHEVNVLIETVNQGILTGRREV